jgi:hypothetical protein
MQIRIAIIALALFLGSTAAQAADNPLFGTWRLNLGKSEFYPGPPPQYHINIYSQSGVNGVKYTSNRANAQGVASRIEFTAAFDGRDYSMTGDDRGSIAITRVSERVFLARYKSGGVVGQIKAWIVSDDGKTLTILSTGSLDGEPFNNIAVFDKQ